MTTELVVAEHWTTAFGRVLLGGGKLAQPDWERALRLEKETREGIHLIVTKLGLVTESDAAQALSQVLEFPLAREDDYPLSPIRDDSISTKFLRQHQIVPLRESDRGLCLAMADPTDRYALAAMELFIGGKVVPWVGVPAEIENALDRLYRSGASGVGELAKGTTTGEEAQTEKDVARLRDLASEAPVIRMVNLLIGNASELRASDIHIEPFERRLRVRYRVDGVLREVDAPPQRLQAAVISRIKIMANLNIAERRLPQDGRIKMTIRGKDIDMRISTIPTLHGESVVMRLLDRGEVKLSLPDLGFTEPVLSRFQDILHRPNGVLLVTGPTGSGKTTTLYACLLELNTPERKILTVEDPIEYQLDGINQVQVKPQIGLDFAHTLRSFLRQDPDVVMIGEIRDLETAQIAVQASLTGHLVLSTLHTNDATSSISRLLDMRVEDYLLTSTVTGILAQRLVRTLCPHCREPHPINRELLARLGAEAVEEAADRTVYRAVGCKKCRGTGFHGRTMIMELLPITDAIRNLILSHAESQELRRVAVSEGMRTMYDDGIRKVLAGITTIEEVLRVTREE